MAQKKECLNRSVVTTPTEIVKYMVEKTLSRLCADKTPNEICDLHIADIACGSGVFLEEVFQYLQSYCIEWYIKNDKTHLIETHNGGYKLPLEEKSVFFALASMVLTLIFTLLKWQTSHYL